MNKAIISIITYVFVAGLLCSCATTNRTEDYQPNSTQEKEVLEVFYKIVEARKNQDFEAYMAFFRDDAKIFKRVHPGSNNGSFLPKPHYAESPGEEFSIVLKELKISINHPLLIDMNNLFKNFFT